MDHRYSADTITIEGGDPAVVEHLNDVLETERQGRPLAPPVRPFGTRAVVPVVGADPLAVVATLRSAATAGDPGADADPRAELVFYNGTFTLLGKDIGHGLSYAELTHLQDVPPPPAWTRPPTGLRRPVIALLDSGVRHHPWLPAAPDDPFVLHSDDSGLGERWQSPVEEAKDDDPETGHATFIAGLVRFAAPSARVLSVRVMNGQGKVNESTVVDALGWLERYRREHPVDVLLLAFGRQPGDREDPQAVAQIEAPLCRLAQAGVAIVASAGNEHQDQQIYPARSAHVTAVGAGFGDYHATFSNYGSWVHRYREGVNMLSIMPPDKWVRWSGTSFSAADFAADLARPHVV
jgi:hypothetical protein